MTAQILQFARMVTPKEQLPNRIRELRQAKGMTQNELAERLNTTYATVGRLETGARELTMSWMKLIAKALDVDAGQILLHTDNSQGISDAEWSVIRAMRDGDPAAVHVLVGLAERTLSYTAEPSRLRKA